MNESLYFADSNNYCIRNVDLTTHIISTVAGNFINNEVYQNWQDDDNNYGATSADVNLPTAFTIHPITGLLYVLAISALNIVKLDTN